MTNVVSQHTCANCREKFHCKGAADGAAAAAIKCLCIEDATVQCSEIVYHFYCCEQCFEIGKAKKPLYIIVSPPSEDEDEIVKRWVSFRGSGKDKRLHLTPIARKR
jgi:hypothetical protein